MLMNKIKNVACAIGIAASISTYPLVAQADEFPSKPITLISGFPAGDLTDTVARLYADKLTTELGSPVIVENKPGAGQRLAIKTLLTSDPDGYTLLIGTGSALAQGPAARKNFNFGYDPRTDFTFIGPIGNLMGAVTVNPEVPANSMEELIDYAHANPGSLMYGSSGIGGAGHLLGAYFASSTNSDMIHVPFHGSADALRAVAAGDAHVAFTPLGNALPMVKAGQLKALLLMATAPQLSQAPDVPTLASVKVEALKGLYPYSFFAIVGPKGMDDAVVGKIHAAMSKVSAMPEVQQRLTETFLVEPSSASQDEFREFIKEEYSKWEEIGKTISGNN